MGFIKYIKKIVLLIGLAVNKLYCDSLNINIDNLTKLADYYGTDKGSSGHYYTEVYELFFSSIRGKVKKILEIGAGPSEYMFRDYFSSATVYAIDINPEVKKYEGERIIIFIGDQSKREDLEVFISKYGCDFDIILDDGGHNMDEQQISFGYLFKCLKPGGFYIIEDIHTSFGIDNNISTLGMIYHFIETNEWKSKYMTDEEINYLNRNVKYCNLIANRIKEDSVTLICKKYDEGLLIKLAEEGKEMFESPEEKKDILIKKSAKEKKRPLLPIKEKK